MKYELLKRSHIKRNIIVAVIVVFILSAIILSFTQAKYRTTESIPLIQGTINFSPSDFNIVAMYLNKGDETVSTKKAPHVGYTLNTEQSICVVDDAEDENGDILFENGNLTFQNMNYSGTKCSVYFDLIPDSEEPTLSISTSSTDNSITVVANASDNVGIYYYYFKIDNREEIRLEENSYTFEGLVKDDIHTITVRVEDAVGNVASDSREVTVGLKSGDYVLASENAPTESTTDWTGELSYYYIGNPNNWFKFAGFYWRIIRVNGDRSVRIIYQGVADSDIPDSENITGISTQVGNQIFNSSYNNNMYVGFKYGSNSSDYATTHANINNSAILGTNNSDDTTTLNGWYRANLIEYANYLDGNVGFCGDRIPSTNSSVGNGLGGTGNTDTYYGSYMRLTNNGNPSLQCDNKALYTTTDSSIGNKSLQYPIGLISADEVALTKITYNSSNKGSYLYTEQNYWTMSPSAYSNNAAFVFNVRTTGYLSWSRVNSENGVRPVINIHPDTILTGSGTTTDPFVVVS